MEKRRIVTQKFVIQPECACCFEVIPKNSKRALLNNELKEIFKKYIGDFQIINQGVICTRCRNDLRTFSILLNYFQVLRDKHMQRDEGILVQEVNLNEIEDPESSPNTAIVGKKVVIDPMLINSLTTGLVKKILHKSDKSSHKKDPELPATKDHLTFILDHQEYAKKPSNVPEVSQAVDKLPPSQPIHKNNKINHKIIKRVDFKATQKSQEDPDDPDEVIVLPPEPPIDLDAIPDEDSPKEKEPQSNLIKCEFCCAVSNKQEILNEHLRIMHQFPCSQCDEIQPTEEHLQRHIRCAHRVGGANKRKQALEARSNEEANFRMRNYRPPSPPKTSVDNNEEIDLLSFMSKAIAIAKDDQLKLKVIDGKKRKIR